MAQSHLSLLFLVSILNSNSIYWWWLLVVRSVFILGETSWNSVESMRFASRSLLSQFQIIKRALVAIRRPWYLFHYDKGTAYRRHTCNTSTNTGYDLIRFITYKLLGVDEKLHQVWNNTPDWIWHGNLVCKPCMIWHSSYICLWPSTKLIASSPSQNQAYSRSNYGAPANMILHSPFAQNLESQVGPEDPIWHLKFPCNFLSCSACLLSSTPARVSWYSMSRAHWEIVSWIARTLVVLRASSGELNRGWPLSWTETLTSRWDDILYVGAGVWWCCW